MSKLTLKTGKTIEINSIQHLKNLLNDLSQQTTERRMISKFEKSLEEIVDLTSLPVWGEEIGDTYEIWSYDNTSPDYCELLVSDPLGGFEVTRVSKNLN